MDGGVGKDALGRKEENQEEGSNNRKRGLRAEDLLQLGANKKKKEEDHAAKMTKKEEVPAAKMKKKEKFVVISYANANANAPPSAFQDRS